MPMVQIVTIEFQISEKDLEMLAAFAIHGLNNTPEPVTVTGKKQRARVQEILSYILGESVLPAQPSPFNNLLRLVRKGAKHGEEGKEPPDPNFDQSA